MKWMKENYPDFVWANVEKEVDFDPEAQSYIVQPHARDQVNIKGRNAVSNIVILHIGNCSYIYYVLSQRQSTMIIIDII